MLATFVIEVCLLLIVAVKHGYKDPLHRLIAVMLFFLALFQLAEFYVCGGLGVNARLWSRIGFVAITMLPPLGLHLARNIAGKQTVKSRILVVAAYFNAFVWALVLMFSSHVLTSYECAGNYAIFELGSPYGGQYFAYYFGWLVVAMIASYLWANRTKSKLARQRLYWLIFGYGTFMLPVAITAALNPDTMRALPSIMCGFAVIFALVLVFGIRPAKVYGQKLTK